MEDPKGEREIAVTRPVKPQYKSALEEAWKKIPADRFWRAIAHIETVLLSISTDGGPTVNEFNGVGPAGALNHWAEHLRSALKELTR